MYKNKQTYKIKIQNTENKLNQSVKDDSKSKDINVYGIKGHREQLGQVTVLTHISEINSNSFQVHNYGIIHIKYVMEMTID